MKSCERLTATFVAGEDGVEGGGQLFINVHLHVLAEFVAARGAVVDLSFERALHARQAQVVQANRRHRPAHDLLTADAQESLLDHGHEFLQWANHKCNYHTSSKAPILVQKLSSKVSTQVPSAKLHSKCKFLSKVPGVEDGYLFGISECLVALLPEFDVQLVLVDEF